MFTQILSFFESNRIDPFTDWIVQFVTHNGILAPMILLFLEESGVPLPIPGDLYIAYTGYLVSMGQIPYYEALGLLVVAVLLGASVLFYLSSHYGQIIVLRFGAYIHLDEKKLLFVEEKFRKYGVLVIIFGRHIPGLRIPITVFSGMSGISYRTFISSTFISIIFWIGLYLYVGQRLGKRVFALLHVNHILFLLLLIPFFIFFISVIYIKFYGKRRKKMSHKK